MVATVATLFFLPVVFSIIRHKMRPREADDDVDLADVAPAKAALAKPQLQRATQY
jgi:hypothetical protein